MGLGYLVREGAGERIGASLLKQRLTTDAWTEDLTPIMTQVTRDTAFDKRWQINQSPKRDYINVFIVNFDSAPTTVSKDGFAQLRHNCSYVGPPNTIVCDQALLASFLQQVGISAWYKGHSQEKQMIERDQQALLYWIMAHEIGHIVKNHKPAHFAANAFESMVASSSFAMRQEFEADSFVVSTMQHGFNRVAIEAMLLDVVNAQIRRKLGAALPAGVGIIYDYSNQNVVEYLRQGPHPEFVVRAARLLSVSAEKYHDLGLNNMAGKFISHLREGASDARSGNHDGHR